MNKAATENCVTRWFGPRFEALHPLLQDLHRHGGRLHGRANIRLGYGLAGFAGRRLARKLGVPTDAPQRGFEVRIRHHEHALHWERRFDNGTRMISVFKPIGTWPDGCWIERTGFLRLRMTVDVIDGGWYWRPLAIEAGGVRIPLWLFPRSHAFKRIEDDKYRFSVTFTLPLLGTVLEYEGLLDATPASKEDR